MKNSKMVLKPKKIDEIKKIFKRTSLSRILVFVLFLLWCGSFVFGLGWAFLASLNTHPDLMRKPFSVPTSFHFENYLQAFDILQTGGTSLVDMFFNSIWFTVGVTAVSMAVVTMAGYSLGNFKYKGRNFILVAIVVISMIPIYGAGSSTLIMYKKLGMYDSPLFILSSASMLNGNTLIIMTFFQTLSPAYEEAAKIDGAGYFDVFFKIHLPMVLPAISSIALLTLIAGWNNVDAPLYYLPHYPTLATGIYKYQNFSKYSMNLPVFFAGLIMCAIPPLIIFTAFREKIMTSVTIGGIK